MSILGNSSLFRSVNDSIVKFFSALEKAKQSQRWWSPKGLLLFILPLPLLPALIISLAKGDLNKSVIHVSAIVIFLAGALIARRGFQQENEFLLESKRVSLTPLKNIAAVLIAVGTFLCSWLAVQHTLLFSLLLAALAYLAFYLSYGFDPKLALPSGASASGMNATAFQQTLEEAEQKIAKILLASQHVRNPELKQRLTQIVSLAKKIVKTIEQNPQDVHRMRKFLYVYLDGTQQVAEGYVKTHSQQETSELEEKFRNVLVTIENVFQQQQNRMLEKAHFDLDVQIEVLNKRLKEEGL